jgi:hypothetical protein
MSNIHPAHVTIPSSPRTATPAGLSGGLVLLLGAGAGLAAASLYYSQPMLGLLADDLGLDTRSIGYVPTLTTAAKRSKQHTRDISPSQPHPEACVPA